MFGTPFDGDPAGDPTTIYTTESRDTEDGRDDHGIIMS